MTDLHDNVFNAARPRDAAKLKLWRYAGLMLTYRCNAACRFCYYCCGPDAGGLMPTEMALAAWTALRRLAGEAASVHLTGGEPFLYFDRLLEICEYAQRLGLGGADYVETNTGWLSDEGEARHRLKALDAAGLQRLKISWDVFHEEFVPVEKVQALVRIGREILGADRVLVRWEKYLDDPSGIAVMNEAERVALLTRSMAADVGRFTGRAAESLAPLCAHKTLADFTGLNCANAILGAKGVHIDPFGNVFSGQCSGMAVGNVQTVDLDILWKKFNPCHDDFWRVLAAAGPGGFVPEALAAGYAVRAFYASKCHLCADIRSFYFDKGLFLPIICPAECYGKQAGRRAAASVRSDTATETDNEV